MRVDLMRSLPKYRISAALYDCKFYNIKDCYLFVTTVQNIVAIR